MGNWRLVGVLFVIAVALGGVAYWQSQAGGGGDETAVDENLIPESGERLLDGVTLADVVRLEVRDEVAGVTVVYEQANGRWFETEPVEREVTQILPEVLAPVVAAVSEQQIAVGVNGLAVYGLENPALTIVMAVERPDGQIGRVVLMVGDLTPTGTGYYLQKRGDGRVHVVSQGVIGGLLNLLRLG